MVDLVQPRTTFTVESVQFVLLILDCIDEYFDRFVLFLDVVHFFRIGQAIIIILRAPLLEDLVSAEMIGIVGLHFGITGFRVLLVRGEFRGILIWIDWRIVTDFEVNAVNGAFIILAVAELLGFIDLEFGDLAGSG